MDIHRALGTSSKQMLLCALHHALLRSHLMSMEGHMLQILEGKSVFFRPVAGDREYSAASSMSGPVSH